MVNILKEAYVGVLEGFAVTFRGLIAMVEWAQGKRDLPDGCIGDVLLIGPLSVVVHVFVVLYPPSLAFGFLALLLNSTGIL